MKIALVCPANMFYMPYVNNYERILRANDVEYEIINWDRIQIEDIENNLTFRDSKKTFKRNYFDYLNFRKFILNKISTSNYEKIIVFGIQLSYFLKRYLLKYYKGRYILDIRDYNIILKFFDIGKIIDNSHYTVLSSPGYKEFLPRSDKYIINHNTVADSLNNLGLENEDKDKKYFNISNIGAARDYEINIKLIESLKNMESINLYYHGDSSINKDINAHLDSNNIKNVFLTGRYNRKDEEILYQKSDLINVLRYNDGINNKTALPNRLYNAVVYGKPMIAFRETYLAELIEKYNLGIVLDSFDGLEGKIINYFNNFDRKIFGEGRMKFFSEVIEQNNIFEKSIEEFIGF